MMHRDLLASIVEDWYDIALRMKNDPKANKAFGWILEMFAFSIAASQAPDGPLDFQLHGMVLRIMLHDAFTVCSIGVSFSCMDLSAPKTRDAFLRR